MLIFLGTYLTLTGFIVTASSRPETLGVRLLCFVLGALLFALIISMQSKINIAVFAASGAALMIANLFVSESIFGARSWLTILNITFQPSELLKVCAVITFGSLADRKNYTAAGLYALAVVLMFAAINDFGGALIAAASYFAAAGVTIFSTGLGTTGLFAALKSKHVLQRLLSWGQAWSDPTGAGYQQTRAMAALASGGLFGAGFRKGWLKNVAAADTDMAFAFVCQEGGLIFASTLILSLLVICCYSLKGNAVARAAGAMLVSQALFNTAGSIDLLPFTGVTFPFVSRGGSSLIASWGLMALIVGGVHDEKILCRRDNDGGAPLLAVFRRNKIHFGRGGVGGVRI